MKRVLFVCHGNICRSPMAQFIFQDLVNKKGLSDQFVIDSRATSTEEIGNSPHYGTVSKLREEGIPVLPHKATRITMEDYKNFDYIIGMDSENMIYLKRMTGGDPNKKLYKLLSFTGSNRDVRDPWYTGNFNETFMDIHSSLIKLLEFLN